MVPPISSPSSSEVEGRVCVGEHRVVGAVEAERVTTHCDAKARVGAAGR